MAARMERTRTPGIYKRGGRYVVVWRHRGKQHKSFHRTYEEAREAKGRRQAGDSRPASRVRFSDYFDEWIESYAGRTARGLADRSRDLYRRAVSDHALRRWDGWRLSEIEPTDVRTLYADLRAREVSTSRLRLLRTALSALFTTALEDGIVRMNPVTGVRIPPAANAAGGDDEPAGRPLTRAELGRLLAALPARWRLFFEFLTHTGLRISEAIGLTWEHIELGDRPRVLVREQVYNGKRGRLKSRQGRRDIPLSPAMAERLRTLRPEADDSSRKPVFVTDARTELNRPNLAGRVLKPAAKAAGLTVERDGKRGSPNPR
jgi:integrase